MTRLGSKLGAVVLAKTADGELAAEAIRLYQHVTGMGSRERSSLGYSVQGAPAVLEEAPGGRLRRPRNELDAEEGSALRFDREQWLAARVRRVDGKLDPRLFNPWTVQQHLRGACSVAPEAPRWTAWVALDIDAHQREGESQAQAEGRALEMLGRVWRAFRFSSVRQPIVLSSPRGGFHVWIPLTRGAGSSNPEHTWPRDWLRAWVVAHLRKAGLEERSGELELFPSGHRLRLPCGVGTSLLTPRRPDDPDDLALGPWEGTYAYRYPPGVLWTRVRRVLPMVRAFCDAFEARRFTVAELLDEPDAEWDPEWAFLARRPAPPDPAAEKNDGTSVGDGYGRIQQIAEVQPAAGGGPKLRLRGSRRGRGRKGGPAEDVLDQTVPSLPDPDPDLPAAPVSGLVRGATYARKVTKLLTRGITEPHVRFDAVKTLTFHWGARCGLGRSAVLTHLERWCLSLVHEGSATLRKAGPTAFLRTCLAEARSYYDACHEHWPFRGNGGGVPSKALTSADHAVLAQVDARVRDEAAAVLSWLAGNADPRGLIDDPVELAHGLLRVLCGQRRVSRGGRRCVVLAVEELVRLGVLTLHTDYALGNHGRVYTCWYRFGSGELPRLLELPAGAELVVPSVSPRARDRVRGTVSTETRYEALSTEMAGCRVLAQRVADEGTLLVLSNGTRAAPRVALLRRGDHGTGGLRDARGVTWWTAHFLERRFSSGEFRDVAPAVAVRLGRKAWPVYRWMRQGVGMHMELVPRARPAGRPPLMLSIPTGVVEAMPPDLRTFLLRPWHGADLASNNGEPAVLAA